MVGFMEPDVTGTTDLVTLWIGMATSSMAEGRLRRARIDLQAALDYLNDRIEIEEQGPNPKA